MNLVVTKSITLTLNVSVFFLTLIYNGLVFGSDVESEYFGVFEAEPQLEVKSNPNGRPTFLLLKDFSFLDPNGLSWVVPEGWEVDGASIPKFAWSIVGGPLSGKYLHASIIHDRYCDTKTRTAHDTHRNFLYGMLANGVSDVKAKTMYWAVRTFGPNWKIVKKRITSGVTNGSGKFKLETVLIDPPSISEDQARNLLENLDTELNIEYLDELSDLTRIELKSQDLQRVAPSLKPSEQLGNDLNPQLDMRKILRDVF